MGLIRAAILLVTGTIAEFGAIACTLAAINVWQTDPEVWERNRQQILKKRLEK